MPTFSPLRASQVCAYSRTASTHICARAVQMISGPVAAVTPCAAEAVAGQLVRLVGVYRRAFASRHERSVRPAGRPGFGAVAAGLAGGCRSWPRASDTTADQAASSRRSRESGFHSGPRPYEPPQNSCGQGCTPHGQASSGRWRTRPPHSRDGHDGGHAEPFPRPGGRGGTRTSLRAELTGARISRIDAEGARTACQRARPDVRSRQNALGKATGADACNTAGVRHLGLKRRVRQVHTLAMTSVSWRRGP